MTISPLNLMKVSVCPPDFPLTSYSLVPGDLDILEERISNEKNTLNLVWKRINDKRLPPIPKRILSVRITPPPLLSPSKPSRLSLQNYFNVLLEYYHSIPPSQSLYNKISKNLLELLQLVNNEQTKTSILDQLKQHHQNFSEQIDNEKFCEADTTLVRETCPYQQSRDVSVGT